MSGYRGSNDDAISCEVRADPGHPRYVSLSKRTRPSSLYLNQTFHSLFNELCNVSSGIRRKNSTGQ